MKKLLICFRGLNNIFEDDTAKKWAQEHGYELKVFNYFEVDEAESWIRKTNYDHIWLLGYSRGAVSAYDLAKRTPTMTYKRMLTVGSYHTVTSSFGKSRPALPNVVVHRNYIETHQQPKDFAKNINNISLGKVSHFEAVKATFDLIKAHSS
jgi:pimeloyl-ACP methyl ester carboxylesterase